MTVLVRWFYHVAMKKAESSLLEQLKQYENKWVALEHPNKSVVGSGGDASEAKKDAERKGYEDVILFRVLPFQGGYVPHA